MGTAQSGPCARNPERRNACRYPLSRLREHQTITRTVEPHQGLNSFGKNPKTPCAEEEVPQASASDPRLDPGANPPADFPAEGNCLSHLRRPYAGLAVGAQSAEPAYQTSSYGALVRFEPYPDASRHGAAGFWGFAGYNRKFKALVAGLEADFGYAKPPPIQQKPPYGTLDPRTFGFNASFRARLGLALFDRLMIYGTGGLQLAAIQSHQDANLATRIYPGWTVGAGIEALLTPTISVRAEYLRSHFPSPGVDAQTIRAGVAIKF